MIYPPFWDLGVSLLFLFPIFIVVNKNLEFFPQILQNQLNMVETKNSSKISQIFLIFFKDMTPKNSPKKKSLVRSLAYVKRALFVSIFFPSNYAWDKPTRGVSITLWPPLPFTFQSILRQKKNYGKTQLFHHAKIYNLQKKIL